MAVSDNLFEAKYFPRKNSSDVFTGMTKCSVPDFKGPFELLLSSECLVHIELDSIQVNDQKTLAKVKNISLNANN